MPRKPPSLCLPVSYWPDIDRRLWSAGLHGGGLFDDDRGAGAHWSPASRRKTASGYGRWLCWLMDNHGSDRASCLADAPGQRVTRDRVVAYLHHLGEATAPMTRLCRIQELRDAMRILAPDDDWMWLDALYRNIRSRTAPTRQKHGRLRLAGDLVALGISLMEAAEATPDWSARRRAVHYRDGLMISLLAHRPVRVKNFASMRLGMHLLEQGPRLAMVFQAAETKTKTIYDAHVPDSLMKHLRRYLAVHRPVLLAGEQGGALSSSDALWVSEVGTQLESGALSRRIAKHTAAAFGRSVPPHWFRDAAATSIAIDNPAFVRDAHLVLGHAGLGTTERHYNQARSLQASRRYAAMLAGLGGTRQSWTPPKTS